MNKPELKINIVGNYRLTVRDGNTVVADTGWSKNTILSSGLVYLASEPIPDILQFLDLGTSSAMAGTSSYSLSGVITPSVNTALSNVERNNIQTLEDRDIKNVRSYYVTFTTQKAEQLTESITEFSIKPGTTRSAFSRAVLPEPVTVRYNQAVNFEYLFTVDWSSYHESQITPFRINSYTISNGASSFNTFTIPTTSQIYNVPGNSLFDPLNKIILLKNNSEVLNAFGDIYPTNPKYGLLTEEQSTFESRTLSAYLDENRCFNILTEFPNISTFTVNELLTGIDTAILRSSNNIDFLYTRFQFPFTVYNYKSFSNVINTTSYDPMYDIYAKNVLSLVYRYVWGEGNISSLPKYSTLTTNKPVIIVEDPIIPCSVDQIIPCGPVGAKKIPSNPANYRIRIYLGSKIGPYSFNYRCNDTAAKFSIVYFPGDDTTQSPVFLKETGYRGSTTLNSSLQKLGLELEGLETGQIILSKETSTYTFVDVIVYSPLAYSGFSDEFIAFYVTCPDQEVPPEDIALLVDNFTSFSTEDNFQMIFPGSA